MQQRSTRRSLHSRGLLLLMTGVLAASGLSARTASAQVQLDQSTIAGSLTVTHAPPGVSSIRVSVTCTALNGGSAATTTATFPITGGTADIAFPLTAASTCAAGVELLDPSGSVASGFRARTSIRFGTSVQADDVALTNGAYRTQVVVAGGNGQGSALDQLDGPRGILRDRLGNVYVSDLENFRVVRWAPGATVGTVVAGGNGTGSGLDQIASPYGMVVDATNALVVVDRLNQRVVRWAPGATSGVVVAGGNGAGNALNQLDNPYGIAIDPAGNLYVTESTNHRVVRWAPGATSGVVVAGGNGAGNALNQLDGPYGIAIDPAGNLFIADRGNHRVVRWAPGATSGVVVAGGNGAGNALNQLDGPRELAGDERGNVYVADTTNHRVVRWAPGATSGVVVAGGTGSGPALDQLLSPVGLTIDPTGNLFIGDRDNHRVVRWLPYDQWPRVAGSTTMTVKVDFPPSIRVVASAVGTQASPGASYPIAIRCITGDGGLLSLDPSRGFTSVGSTRVVSLTSGATYWVTGWDFVGFDVDTRCVAAEADSKGADVSIASSTPTGTPQPGATDPTLCFVRAAWSVVGITDVACGTGSQGDGTDPVGVFRSAWTTAGQTITITNATTGNLTVATVVTGDPRTNIATYEITVACTNGGPRETFLLKDRQSRTLTGIPVGSSCLVVETRTDGAEARITDNSGDSTTDGRVVIVRGDTGCRQLGATSPDRCDAIVTITNDHSTRPGLRAAAADTPAPATPSANVDTTMPAVGAAPATAVESTPEYTG